MSDFTDSARENQVNVGDPPRRGRRGRWIAGQSGNPTGKPRGCRSHRNRELDQILEQNGSDILERVLKGARSGDTGCMRLILERLVPPKKSRTVQIDGFPVVTDLESADAAQTRLLSAVAAGELGLEEAEMLSNLISEKRKLLETRDIVMRIRALEARAGAAGPVLDHTELSFLPDLMEIQDVD
jgi:hypothetical protein